MDVLVVIRPHFHIFPPKFTLGCGFLRFLVNAMGFIYSHKKEIDIFMRKRDFLIGLFASSLVICPFFGFILHIIRVCMCIQRYIISLCMQGVPVYNGILSGYACVKEILVDSV